jgi:integrase/recombinase XerD
MSRRRSQPKRGGRQVFSMGSDPLDPAGFSVASSEWIEWMRTHNFSHATLVQHSFSLSKFVGWAELRGVTRPEQVTLPVLEAYQRHVSLRRKSDGTPLAWSTQTKRLAAVRVFFSWCTRQRRIGSNPASELVMPRQSHKLPAATLTHDEAEAVLALPDVGSAIGLRDRTVMEILYATAMRRGELVGLDLPDVDLARRWLTLRDTKNRWDRVVPMGERAAAWLTRYLAESRPQLLYGDDPGAVFLATNGERLGATWLSGQVHRYIEASDVGKSGSCHLFRHSAATLMLEGGADIRYIQELLGHRDLSSTHIYTRVAPERLAAIHAATHPGARLSATHDRTGRHDTEGTAVKSERGAPPPAGPQGSSADAADHT